MNDAESGSQSLGGYIEYHDSRLAALEKRFDALESALTQVYAGQVADRTNLFGQITVLQAQLRQLAERVPQPAGKAEE